MKREERGMGKRMGKREGGERERREIKGRERGKRERGGEGTER